MLFFCFSSKDRHEIVESILFHLSNYKISIWYDRNKMLMGNDRDYMNFVDGVESCKYAIIILSKNTINSVCANEEIELIYKKYKLSEMYVFPIFYNIDIQDIPENMMWMKKLVYKEINKKISTLSTCNHIICKIIQDELAKYKILTFENYAEYFYELNSYNFLNQLIKSYREIDEENLNSKISLLYAGCLYINNRFNTKDVPEYYNVGLVRLFEQTKLNIEIDLREIWIAESLFLLILNASVFGYTV